MAETDFAGIHEADRHAATEGYSSGGSDHTLDGALDNIHWQTLEALSQRE